MGRSRGGLTTKIHALVDANGMPIRLKLTEGQAHDGKSAADLIATLPPERHASLSRHQQRLDKSIAASFEDSEDKMDASVEDRQGLGTPRTH